MLIIFRQNASFTTETRLKCANWRLPGTSHSDRTKISGMLRFLYKGLKLCAFADPPPPPPPLHVHNPDRQMEIRSKGKIQPLVCSDFPSIKIHRKILGDTNSHKKRTLFFISRVQSQKDNTVWSISFCCVPGLDVSITVRLTRMHVADITEYTLEKERTLNTFSNSVADPECLSGIRIFLSRITDPRSKKHRIPHPDLDPRQRI